MCACKVRVTGLTRRGRSSSAGGECAGRVGIKRPLKKLHRHHKSQQQYSHKGRHDRQYPEGRSDTQSRFRGLCLSHRRRSSFSWCLCRWRNRSCFGFQLRSLDFQRLFLRWRRLRAHTGANFYPFSPAAARDYSQGLRSQTESRNARAGAKYFLKPGLTSILKGRSSGINST